MSDYISATLREGSEVVALAARPTGPQLIRARGDRRRRHNSAGFAVAALAAVAAGAGAYPLAHDSSAAPATEGGSERTVPRVAGDTLLTAKRAIVRAGLSVGHVSRHYSDAIPLGQVMGTSPPYSASEHKGAKVSIVLSAGGGPIVVPNVVGMTEPAAEQLLLQMQVEVVLQMQVEVRSAVSRTAVPGTIAAESPAAGSDVPRGSTIVLYVEPAKRGS